MPYSCYLCTKEINPYKSVWNPNTPLNGVEVRLPHLSYLGNARYASTYSLCNSCFERLKVATERPLTIVSESNGLYCNDFMHSPYIQSPKGLQTLPYLGLCAFLDRYLPNRTPLDVDDLRRYMQMRFTQDWSRTLVTINCDIGLKNRYEWFDLDFYDFAERMYVLPPYIKPLDYVDVALIHTKMKEQFPSWSSPPIKVSHRDRFWIVATTESPDAPYPMQRRVNALTSDKVEIVERFQFPIQEINQGLRKFKNLDRSSDFGSYFVNRTPTKTTEVSCRSWYEFDGNIGMCSVNTMGSVSYAGQLL